jgi:hypothetical protein
MTAELFSFAFRNFSPERPRLHGNLCMRILTFICVSALALITIDCGGGSSSSAQKMPLISSLSPSSGAVASSPLSIAVTGSNFSSGCLARWDGSERTTSYVSSTSLTFITAAGDISATGSHSISVACNSKISNAVNFPVVNPTPVVTGASPSNATAGGNNFTLTVIGSNYINASTVQWNGVTRTTAYVSSTALTIEITHTDISNSGTSTIKVVNPSPGGGTSNTLNYAIKPLKPISIATKQLPDAVQNKTYSYELQGDGGVSPYSWSIVSGALPTGLSLVSGKITGIPPAVSSDTDFPFGARVIDSAYQPSSATQSLSIRVRSAGLGRNDTCATATAISNGTIRASISPYGDIDVYSFQGNQGSTASIEILAQRLSDDNYMDSLLELLDSNCNKLSYNDDIDNGVIRDSSINYALPSTGTYYVRVSDLRGDGRPDFIYDLILSGAN